MMTKRFLALLAAMLLVLCFASCKKADEDKTDASSTDETSSYEFILEDDTDESMSPEDEEKAQNAWNSVVKDSSSIEIEPYKPAESSSKPADSSSKPSTSSNQTVTSGNPESSSSKQETTTPSSSSNVSTPTEKPDDTTTSKPGWRPGPY